MEPTYLIPPLTRVTLIRDPASNDANHPIIEGPFDIFPILERLIGEQPQEHFLVCGLDVKGRLLGIHLVYIGTVGLISLRMAEVLRPAILMNAENIIVAHNHPSGDPTPGHNDIIATKQLAEAARLLDIEFRDHLILGHKQYVSLKERGLIPVIY